MEGSEARIAGCGLAEIGRLPVPMPDITRANQDGVGGTTHALSVLAPRKVLLGLPPERVEPVTFLCGYRRRHQAHRSARNVGDSA